jgi:hypothetical protein
MKATLALALLFLQVSAASAQVGSGNDLLQACNANLAGIPKNTTDAGDSFYCLGVVTTILQLQSKLDEQDKFCPPIQISAQQAVRVIVKFLTSNPELLHLKASTLTVSALKQAWPCP